MCGGSVCGIATSVVGAVLVVAVSIVAYGAIPKIIDQLIVNEVILLNDTIQLERFETVPFALNFTVYVWNITNPDEVLSGAIPSMTEVGPYIYKLYQDRVINNFDGDMITYRRLELFEFDHERSYPNTEDDLVTIVNVPYNAILQVAESLFPGLMPILNQGLNGVFGEYNSPIMEVRVGELLLDGIGLCQNPELIGAIACTQVLELSSNANNIEKNEDGSLLFSLLRYKHGIQSKEYVVHRGLEDSKDLGRIALFDGLPNLLYWVDDDDQPGVCNMLNGTDSGIFNPLIDRDTPIYALNTDICRSVELRYQWDTEYEDISVARYSANEWFLDNEDHCFCLNVTGGVGRSDGCMLPGAQELYSCVGAFLVLSYPHFLYADFRYRHGVLGMNPKENEHRIFLDLDPLTGTVMRGAKRAQFNIFMRPVTGIPATANLLTTLTPIVWIEEGMSLPKEFVDELKIKLFTQLELVGILIPVFLAVSCLIFIAGIVILVVLRLRRPLKQLPQALHK